MNVPVGIHGDDVELDGQGQGVSERDRWGTTPWRQHGEIRNHGAG